MTANQTPIPRTWRQSAREIAALVAWGLPLAMSLIQFRMLAFVLMAAAAAMMLATRAARRRPWVLLMSAVIVVAMFLPVDVALGGFHYGSHHGTSLNRPRLVRFVVGMPRHSRLIETHGEYISGGCTFLAIVPPTWIWLWS